MTSEYQKYMIQLSRGLILLLIYEVIGLLVNYLYRSYKINKVTKLAQDNNKKLLILDDLDDLQQLVNLNDNSHVILFDNILEYTDLDLDEKIRNEVDRVTYGDIRHIYKPFYLLSSYLKTKRVFITAERTKERYIELSSIYSRLMILLIFVLIFVLIANYTPIKTYINDFIKYISSNSNSTLLDSETSKDIKKLSQKIPTIMNRIRNRKLSPKMSNLTTENSSINNTENRVLSEVRNNLNKVKNNILSETNNTTENMMRNINNIRNKYNNNNIRNKLNNNINEISNKLNNNINEMSNKLNNNINMMSNNIRNNLMK